MRLLTAGILVLATILSACNGTRSRAVHRKVIVLGVDGMDPGFVERHWNNLPSLRRLRDRGGFSRLATTDPPQSPVAWSTFITGRDPSQSGIFDFVHRDPSTLLPLSSMAETLPPEHQLTLGPYQLPLSKARVRSFRRGRAFWELLSERGIPVNIVRMPTNYPPVPAGQALAGMGTPDLQGTFGTFTYYSSDLTEVPGDVSGGRFVRVLPKNNRAILTIEGPANTLRRDGAVTKSELTVDIDPDAPVARFEIEGRQFILSQGEWSNWIPVRFPLVPGLASVAGMFRLYIAELHPDLRIYVSPINLDPTDPALPISAPARYSRELAGRIGRFYTQGIEEDTSALRAGVLTLPAYLEQSRLVAGEHAAMLRDSIRHFHDGLLFFYFSEIDQNSHMLWGRYDDELLKTYEHIDREIGYVLDHVPDALVIVMSDHGFAPFDRAVNLNTWLAEQGFLQKNELAGAGAETPLANVNWEKTDAYAMGLNALYVNLAGREQHGVVKPGAQYNALLEALIRRLLEFRDPATGQNVVESVSRTNARSDRYAPDLIVGYALGYRASWQTALGIASPAVIEPNQDAWIGDHCIASALVPGVLLSTVAPKLSNPKLKDLTVTILKAFNVEPDRAMSGRPVY